MVPRISSCAARMLASSSTVVGVSFKTWRTMNSTAIVSGFNTTMSVCITGATESEMRSGNASAYVLGSTSAKITTSAVITTVA